MLSRPRSTIAQAARVFATLSLGAVVAVASSVSAFAQNVAVYAMPIEALVRDYARPIFKAAGLANVGIDISSSTTGTSMLSWPGGGCSSTPAP